MAWGSLGEAIGYIAGMSIGLQPSAVGHAAGVLFTAIYTIYRFWPMPITLKQCLQQNAQLYADGLLTKGEHDERRKRCLTQHEY